VGDSRIYRIREGWIEQLTFDHSLVWEYARIKKIDPTKVKDIPSNVIHRCLGPEPAVEVDLEGPYPLAPGDIFLMCSDGLSGQLEDPEMAALASILPPQEACRILVDLANLRGGPDNITAIVIRVKGGPENNGQLVAPTPPPAPSKWDIPWWLPTLFAGAVLAALAVFLRWTGMPGVRVSLFAALATLIAGVVGLVIHHLREKNKPEEDEDSTEPRIHRRSPFGVESALLERIRKNLKSLREQAEERHWEIDWEAHNHHYQKAQQLADQSDLTAALREYCRAMFPLNRAFDKFRAKNEVFKPMWDEPQPR
jgi:protein phosphatase